MMKQSIAAMKNTNIPCDRCEGRGHISRFRHVENGICFKCRGARVQRPHRTYRTVERLVLTEVKAETPKSSEENQWGCEVCGLDEWCGTDGCPLDPQ